LADSVPQLSRADKKALEIWEQSIQVVDGHYHVDIPLKSNEPNLPDNNSVAEKRLQL